LSTTSFQGAAFTFNASSYLAFIRSLRIQPFPSSIPFPTFDHALKDPTPSPHPILPHHRIVVIEGLYTLADKGDWREAAELMDVKIFVECDTSMARERVVRRNFEAGVEDTLEKTIVRGTFGSLSSGLSSLSVLSHSQKLMGTRVVN
jgi:pantothenate kinase